MSTLHRAILLAMAGALSPLVTVATADFCASNPHQNKLGSSKDRYAGLNDNLQRALQAYEKAPTTEAFALVLAGLPEAESRADTAPLYVLGTNASATRNDVCYWVVRLTRKLPPIDAACPNAELAAELQLVGRKCWVIYFGSNKCNITAEANAELEDAETALKECGGACSVNVVGHADTFFPRRYSQRLSECRANAAKSNLVGRGIEESRIKASGRGEDDLEEPTKDGVREPLNRRATIEIN